MALGGTTRVVVLAAMSLAVAGGGCLSPPGASRGYPLYPNSGGRLPVDQVASLNAWLPVGASPAGGAVSFIKSVNGRVVSGLDAAFELVPGCHVVETQRRLLFSSASWTRTEEVGSRVFVLHMKPGHGYSVVVTGANAVSGYSRYAAPGVFGPLAIYAEERSPTGARTARVISVDPTTAAQECPLWRTSAASNPW